MSDERALFSAECCVCIFERSQLYVSCVAQVLVCSREQTSSLEPDRLAGAADSSDPLLAFPSPVLARLHNRTEELKQEKNATKSKYKEARSMFENLQLECRALRKGIAGTSRRCEVEMEKRFGAGVSLETLESFAVNRTLEEMKESSRTKEKVMWKIQNKREEHIKDVRYSLHQRVLRYPSHSSKEFLWRSGHFRLFPVLTLLPQEH